MLLVDTSVWIEYLRDTGSRAGEELERLLDQDLASVATTGPVVMELLSGARSTHALAALEQLTAGLAELSVDPAVDFHAAAAVYRAARASGVTVRGLLDCLIAVVAERHRATLVHRDADLARVAAVLPRLATVDLR